jgi:hypothetical protein
MGLHAYIKKILTPDYAWVSNAQHSCPIYAVDLSGPHQGQSRILHQSLIYMTFGVAGPWGSELEGGEARLWPACSHGAAVMRLERRGWQESGRAEVAGTPARQGGRASQGGSLCGRVGIAARSWAGRSTVAPGCTRGGGLSSVPAFQVDCEVSGRKLRPSSD